MPKISKRIIYKFFSMIHILMASLSICSSLQIYAWFFEKRIEIVFPRDVKETAEKMLGVRSIWNVPSSNL